MIFLIATVIVIIVTLFIIPKIYIDADVILPYGIEQVEYELIEPKETKSADYYFNENTALYKKRFGYVADERTAVDIATIVISEIDKGHNSPKEPFSVGFDEKANIWFVTGPVSEKMHGKAFECTIDKETGKVSMIIVL